MAAAAILPFRPPLRQRTSQKNNNNNENDGNERKNCHDDGVDEHLNDMNFIATEKKLDKEMTMTIIF